VAFRADSKSGASPGSIWSCASRGVHISETGNFSEGQGEEVWGLIIPVGGQGHL